MERLTERTTEGILVKEEYGEEVLKTLYQCFGAETMPHYENCEEGYCAMERLATYEDTDLTPEQINEMDKLYREKCEEVNKLNAELAEYKKLLPCNIGDTVYVVGEWLDSGKMMAIEYTFDGIEDGGYRLIYGGNKEDVDVLPVDDLGRVIFLSEAEAQETLERMEGTK